MAKFPKAQKSWTRGYFQSFDLSDLSSFTVLGGLIIIGIVFQIANPNFLTPLNLTNLMAQISAIGIISVGIVLILLIGEIDLSVGSVSGATAAIMAVLVTMMHVPSIFSIIIAILVGLVIGALQGFFVAKVHVPSFIVTLSGLLIWQGLQMLVLGSSGTINLRDPMMKAVANTLLPPWLGWLIGIAAVFTIAYSAFKRRRTRKQAGLNLEPLSRLISRLSLISIVILFCIGLMNIDRNQVPNGQSIQGIPTSILLFIGFVAVFHIITRYTVFGRHIYAVGGNSEAARRASIDVDKIRISVFSLCSGIAACGGIVYSSRLIAVNYGSGSGSVLLNSIAAAVIGGTSLFGGRGNTWSALIGALVIGSINNGMDLLSFPSSIKNIVTGIVLLFAVILDSISRERRKRIGKG